MTKNVLIVNEGYSSNLGDQAIKQSMEALFTAMGFNTYFSYFTNPAIKQLPAYDYSKIQTTPVKNRFTAIFKNKATHLLSFFIYCRYYFNLSKQVKQCLALQQYHMVVIGGGQLINSSKSNRVSFFAIALHVWAKVIKKMNIPFYIAGIGAAGEFHTIEKILYNRALQYASNIWVRDNFSGQSILKNFKLQANLAPDMAFFNQYPVANYQKDNTALIGIYGYDECKKVFGMAGKSRDMYFAQWKKIIDRYTNMSLKVILFYTTETDAAEAYMFQQYLQTQNVQIPVAAITSLKDLNSIFEKAAYVYAARMHALILAYKKNCRVEAFEISQKLISFTEEYIASGRQPEIISRQLYDTFAAYFKKECI